MVLPLIPLALVAGGTVAASVTGKAAIDALTQAQASKDTTVSIINSPKVTTDNLSEVLDAMQDNKVFSDSGFIKSENYNPVHEDNSSYTDNRTYEYVYTIESPNANVSTNQQPTNTTTQSPNISKSSGVSGVTETLSSLAPYGLLGLGIFCVYKLVTNTKGGATA